MIKCLLLVTLLCVGCLDFDRTPPPILSDYIEVADTDCDRHALWDDRRDCWYELCERRYQWNPDWKSECAEDADMFASALEGN